MHKVFYRPFLLLLLRLAGNTAAACQGKAIRERLEKMVLHNKINIVLLDVSWENLCLFEFVKDFHT